MVAITMLTRVHMDDDVVEAMDLVKQFVTNVLCDRVSFRHR